MSSARSSAEPSRVRRQLRACRATNRPAGGWRSEAGQQGLQSQEQQNSMLNSKSTLTLVWAWTVFRAIVLRKKETRNHKPFPSFSVSISHRRWFKKAVTAGTTLVGVKGLKDENTTDQFNKSLRSSLFHYVFTWQIVVSLHLVRLNVVHWVFNIVTQGF